MVLGLNAWSLIDNEQAYALILMGIRFEVGAAID
jgi:hypothetical protein